MVLDLALGDILPERQTFGIPGDYIEGLTSWSVHEAEDHVRVAIYEQRFENVLSLLDLSSVSKSVEEGPMRNPMAPLMEMTYATQCDNPFLAFLSCAEPTLAGAFAVNGILTKSRTRRSLISIVPSSSE